MASMRARNSGRDHRRVDAAAELVDGGHEIIHQTR